MPKISNTVAKTETPVVTESKEEKATPTISDETLKALLARIDELEAQVKTSAKSEVVNETVAEPLANKQIKLISLYYGALNLATEFGKEPKVVFNAYGQSKNVLYSTLVDIVNYNKKFADAGMFYICDKDAVYFLGLSDVYDNLLSKVMIDNICNFKVEDIDSVLDNVTDAQKDVITHNIAMKIFNGESVDYNTVEMINKKFNVNIQSIADGMKKFADKV